MKIESLCHQEGVDFRDDPHGMADTHTWRSARKKKLYDRCLVVDAAGTVSHSWNKIQHEVVADGPKTIHGKFE